MSQENTQRLCLELYDEPELQGRWIRLIGPSDHVGLLGSGGMSVRSIRTGPATFVKLYRRHEPSCFALVGPSQVCAAEQFDVYDSVMLLSLEEALRNGLLGVSKHRQAV